MGGVVGFFAGWPLPKNLGFMGQVDDETKDVVLSTVDCAINPMAQGSGTNLKMLEYFASGVPVISSPHGARGLAVAGDTHLTLCEISDFAQALRRLKVEINGPAVHERIRDARLLVEDRYAWPVIVRDFRTRVAALGYTC